MSLATGKRLASVSLKSNSPANNENGRPAAPAIRTLPPPPLVAAPAAALQASASPLSATPPSDTSAPGAAAPGPTLRPAVPVSVVKARPGEHMVARQLLASVLRGPSPSEFQSQLDDPYGEPGDRLLCKVREYLVGHARLVRREMRFGEAVLPVSILSDLLVLPEFRGQGCGTALLAESEAAMVADGAALGIVRTNQPRFFLRRGWCVWTRHSFSAAAAREILSRLCESRQSGGAGPPPRPYNIRLWRHIEQSGLTRLYEANTAAAYGPLVRTEAYWQWLLARHAFDRIYVVLDGPDRVEFDEVPAMVGYAVMKDARILELMTSPLHPDAAPQLLARACADAIEQDMHYVRLDAPVGEPMHHVLARAGGELGYHESLQGEVCLVKLWDANRALELLGEVLQRRVRAARLSLPVELGLLVGGERCTLEVRGRTARLKGGRPCRSYLSCSRGDLTQLMLGHLDLKVALAAQRVTASTRVAAELAAALFPRVPLWRPPWDEFPAT